MERVRPVFVGRELELERLDQELESALEGDGRVLFVTGDAGNGKSSLMNAFARQASDIQPDLLVAWGVCFAITGQGDPYLPFRHLLATLTGDIEAGWAAGNLTTEQARVLWQAMPAAVRLLLNDGPDLLNTIVPGSALDSRLSAALPAGDDLITYLQQQLAKGQAVPGEMEQPQLFEQVKCQCCTRCVDAEFLLQVASNTHTTQADRLKAPDLGLVAQGVDDPLLDQIDDLRFAQFAGAA